MKTMKCQCGARLLVPSKNPEAKIKCRNCQASVLAIFAPGIRTEKNFSQVRDKMPKAKGKHVEDLW